MTPASIDQLLNLSSVFSRRVDGTVDVVLNRLDDGLGPVEWPIGEDDLVSAYCVFHVENPSAHDLDVESWVRTAVPSAVDSAELGSLVCP